MKNVKSELAEVRNNLEDLNSWSDDRPESAKEGSPEYLRVKFRTPWFENIIKCVEIINRISDVNNLLKEACILRDKILERRSRNEYTTKDEIKKGDQIIQKALEKIQDIN